MLGCTSEAQSGSLMQATTNTDERLQIKRHTSNSSDFRGNKMSRTCGLFCEDAPPFESQAKLPHGPGVPLLPNVVLWVPAACAPQKLHLGTTISAGRISISTAYTVVASVWLEDCSEITLSRTCAFTMFLPTDVHSAGAQHVFQQQIASSVQNVCRPRFVK